MSSADSHIESVSTDEEVLRTRARHAAAKAAREAERAEQGDEPAPVQVVRAAPVAPAPKRFGVAGRLNRGPVKPVVQSDASKASQILAGLKKQSGAKRLVPK